MKKNLVKQGLMKIVVMSSMVFFLTACDNSNSKVDQVIQQQIQAANAENNPDDIGGSNANASASGNTIGDGVLISNNGADDTLEDGTIIDDIGGSNTIDTYDDNTYEFEINQDAFNEEEGIDVDLTRLSSTMVYSEVYNMMYLPNEYLGKTVRMRGAFSVFQDSTTGNIYYTCIIQDATACCAQGIEFERAGSYTYPDDYPEVNDEITVTGVFDTYEEAGYLYCTLRNAKME